MKLRASPGLKLIVILLTMTLATLPQYLIPESWLKWVIAAVALIVGALVEHRVEQAYLVDDSPSTR